jgi:molybdopterin-binding protein
MKLSARNQLPGTVEQIHLGEIMARIVVKVGEHVIESVITRQSAEDLGLKQGDSVHVVVKSTEVMIQKG